MGGGEVGGKIYNVCKDNQILVMQTFLILPIFTTKLSEVLIEVQ